MNFAFIGSPENYHTSQDTPAHVDLRTLQHAGDYALPLVRRLGDADLAALGAPAAARAPDAVFFNVGDWEVVYPQPWARPLGIAGMALFLVVAAIGIRKGAASLGGVAIAVALLLATVLAAWRTADWMALGLARTTRDGIPLGGAGPFLFHPLYALALGCVVAGLTFAAWELAALRWSDLALAGALVWSALSTVLAFRVPAASYLGFWPLLPMLLATGFALAKRDRPRAAVRILIWLGAVPTVWLLAPLLPQLHLALGLNTLGAPALAILATLALWLLAPLVAPDGGGKLWLAVALLAAGGVLFAVAGRTVRYNARHPRPESMAYVLDSDHATAQWMSPVEGQFVGSETPADAWRRQYLSAKPTPASLPIALGPRGMMLMWEHAAPKVELAPPAAELLESTRQDQLRTVRIRVRSQRHAARISIKAEAPMVIPLEVNGHHLGERTQNGKGYALAMSRGLNDRQFWNLLYAAPPDGGVEVTLLVSPDEPLDLLVADISDGLPDIPGQSFAPRPPEITQQHFADATVVVKHFSFGACDTQSALPTGKRAESR